MTSYQLMLRYPWWSVDSTAYVKAAGYGEIYVPHKRGGKFTFEETPYRLGVSLKYKSHGNRKDIRTWSGQARGVVFEWLEEIGVPFDTVRHDEKAKEWGVTSARAARVVANIKFFDRLCEWLSPYPRAFKPRRSEVFVL